ncbi:MAG: hypothetical protein A2822_00790 [Candidatus Staskawiczbacteria bacterium RIFCSPHIGHO2_01_FULL_41_41]|uniref:Uncharacterized protein n=1 Tax=Candidatus Staskawiczbacteria bacterium RIFCSPHIGHO2_01_FULL_41_41 TaxID=1802203 RepID=A0A1G2HRU2_9BACT|nr:MAG: hypothetical protein A2822_00790 [Candidatus Staskawiczbacteria bacterium RIFCSPHIGHO2_01_FULL_41_41]HLD79654.1 hypothetical protein [Candidatus Nanoarchaeia archaeon]
MSKKWWNALVGKKTQTKKVDVLADIDAITEFLSEVQYDTKELLAQFKKLKELEKEYHIAASGILHINLETQAKLLDKLLERYEFFENDVNVNGLRVKMIAKEFLKRASKAGMTDLVRQKEKDKKWMMLW